MNVTFNLPKEAFGDLGVKELRDVIRAGITRVAYELQTEIVRNSTTYLRVRSGGLRREWARPPKVESRADEITATLSNALPYAEIHDTGEPTIRPVRAKKLYIPLDPVRNASGTRTKVSPREVYETKGSILGMRGVFISKSGRALMGVPFGKDEPPVPLFALADSVTLRATHYVQDAFKSIEARADQIIGDAIENALRKLGFR